MKAIVIESNKDLDINRGLTGEIIDYVVIDKEVHAIFLTWKGYFKNIPLKLLGKDHNLGCY
jgi:hypothetical protein